MKKSLCILVAALAWLTLAGCSSVPTGAKDDRSQLGPRLMECRPEEIVIAIRHDRRLALGGSTLPVLKIQMDPASPGVFEPIREEMPLAAAPLDAQAAQLPGADGTLAWSFFMLDGAQATRAKAIREQVRSHIRAREAGGPGGSLSLSLGITSPDGGKPLPVADDTPLDLHLRIARNEGLMHVWSGNLAELKRLSERSGR